MFATLVSQRGGRQKSGGLESWSLGESTRLCEPGAAAAAGPGAGTASGSGVAVVVVVGVCTDVHVQELGVVAAAGSPELLRFDALSCEGCLLALLLALLASFPASLPLRLQMVEEGRRRRCGREDGPRTGAIMC